MDIESRQKPDRRFNDADILKTITSLAADLSAVKEICARNELLNKENREQNIETHKILNTHITEEHAHIQQQHDDHSKLLAYFDDIPPKVHVKQHEFVNETIESANYLKKIKNDTLAKWIERIGIAVLTTLTFLLFDGVTHNINKFVNKPAVEQTKDNK